MKINYFLLIAALGFTFACNQTGTDSESDQSQENEEMEQTEKIVKTGDTTLPTSNAVLAKMMELDQSGDYTVEDFFRNPEKANFQISPDGDFLSFTSPYEDRMNIHIQKIGEDKVTRITSETDRDIQGYFWANNNRILYLQDDGGDENFKLYAVNRDGSDKMDLTPYDSVRIQIIDDLEDIEDEIIIGMNLESKALFSPYRLNINTGEVEKLAENKNMFEPISGWMTDHEGKLRVAMKVTDGTNTSVLYRDNEEEEFRTVLTTDFTETMAPLFFDFDNGPVVYAASNLGRDKTAIVKYDLNTGEELEKIFSHPEVDVSNLNYSQKRKVLTSISYTTDKRHREILDEKTQALYDRLVEALPDYEVVVTSANRDEDKFLVRTYSDRSLGAYYFYDMESEELMKLAEVSPWLDEEKLSPMQPIKYTSRDGLTIHGYLTLPDNVEAKNLPLVVNPHGGPWARDNWGYNPEVQLLADRGYAVLQVNFRGSTGFGKEFWTASFKEWGQTMQNDITDGVNWLIGQGIADQNRIAIYGASYGGYATLAGLTYTPDLYACGVDYVGVSNLNSFLQTIPPYWKPFLEMMYEMVGDPATDQEMLDAYSPALNSDKITSPLFVVQGANDPRVNIDESDQIVRALRERGVDVPYMVKYDEGHGFSNEENRFDFYKAMTGFLAIHLKGLDIES
jgi:dipeptidyl aminopeptidase/acylaminoacyl peptidase